MISQHKGDCQLFYGTFLIFLPKEEASIHLNTKKRPYRTAEILIHVYNAEHFSSRRTFSVPVGQKQTSHGAVSCPVFVFPVPGKPRFPFRSFLSPFGFRFLLHHRMRFKTLQYCPSSVTASDNQGTVHCSAFIFRSPANLVSPSALFSPFGLRFLPRHRMRFKTLQCRHGSVTAADKSRRRTLSGICLLVPRQTSFPLPLFSRLSVSAFLLHHRMRFKTLQYRHGSVAAADKSRRRTLSGFCLPGPRQTSFPLPLFSLTFRFPLFYCTTVCVSKLFNTAPAPLRRQTNQDAVHCPVFVFPVPGKLRFPFRSFLAFRLPLFTAPPYAFLNSSMPTRLRYGDRQSRRRTLSGLYLPVPGTQRPVLRDISLTEAII